MSDTTKQRPPARLGPSGRALWAKFTNVFRLDQRELVALASACSEADDLEIGRAHV